MKKLLIVLALSLSIGGTLMAKTINEKEVQTKTINKVEYVTAKDTANVFGEDCTYVFEKNKSVDKFEEKKEGIITFTFFENEDKKYEVIFGVNQNDVRVIKYEKSEYNPVFGESMNIMKPSEDKTIIKDGKTYIPTTSIEKALEMINPTN